jgi:hypothetical protein
MEVCCDLHASAFCSRLKPLGGTQGRRGQRSSEIKKISACAGIRFWICRPTKMEDEQTGVVHVKGRCHTDWHRRTCSVNEYLSRDNWLCFRDVKYHSYTATVTRPSLVCVCVRACVRVCHDTGGKTGTLGLPDPVILLRVAWYDRTALTMGALDFSCTSVLSHQTTLCVIADDRTMTSHTVALAVQSHNKSLK